MLGVKNSTASLSKTASILWMTLSWDTTNQGRALKTLLGWDSLVLAEIEI